MSQTQSFSQYHFRLHELTSKLMNTALSPDQQRIVQDVQTLDRELGRFILEDYLAFEEIGDNLPDTIYLYVADKTGKTVYVSELYSQMSGISRKEIIGRNVFQINKEKKLYVNGVLPHVLRQKKHVETIGTMVRTNIRVHLTGVPIFDANGELKYALAFGSDIRQLETIQDQLAKLQESQEKQESEVQYLRMQQIGDVEIVTNSPQMQYAMLTASEVAKTDATVLITGESGTGKEVIANQIFQASHRSEKPFIRINCAAIPESLMESELFGYEPGSFTGASRQGKTGIFELANGGTLIEPHMIQSGRAPEVSVLVKPSTAERLTQLMRNNAVTHYNADTLFPGMAICAKTGTAELGDGDSHSWFVGFLDDEEHPYAFVTLVERGGFGLTKAGAVTSEVLKWAVENLDT